MATRKVSMDTSPLAVTKQRTLNTSMRQSSVTPGDDFSAQMRNARKSKVRNLTVKTGIEKVGFKRHNAVKEKKLLTTE
jgi:hypothetical protein